MITTTDATAPDSLRAALSAAGHVAADGIWRPLAGGRTNQLWCVTSRSDARVVVKLYSPTSENPLFPNDPGMEKRMLKQLRGQGIAADPIGYAETALGPCLVYEHVDGAPWTTGVATFAHALRTVHTLQAPPALRRAPDGSAEIRDQTRRILGLCKTHAARAARALEPDRAPVPPSGCVALLHGDPVAGNLIVSDDAARFIDWQCPALGDPCEDLAIFLSPAMQLAYRGSILTPVERAAFLASYPCPDTTARYRALAPWYHWRMLAYCLWRAEKGDSRARLCAQAEHAALKNCAGGPVAERVCQV